jgi:hypothetical protein
MNLNNSVDYVEIWPADPEGYIRHACETWNLPPPVEFYAAKRAGWSNLIFIAILEDGSVYKMEHAPISEERGPIYNRERTKEEIDFMRRYGLLSMTDMGAKGGRATSEAKRAAVRANGRKGGRPRKRPEDEA